MATRALLTAHAEVETLAAADQVALAELRYAGGPEALLVPVPLLRDDVHDVDRLIGLEQYLFA
jgi:hypothetical protein